MKKTKKTIWITMLQLDGSVAHQEINESHFLYETAIKSGTYNLTKKGAEASWIQGCNIQLLIRKIEEVGLNVDQFDLVCKIKAARKKHEQRKNVRKEQRNKTSHRKGNRKLKNSRRKGKAD